MAAAAERGVELRVLELDLTDPESIRRAVATAVEQSGAIYGLVNNGGVGLRGCLEDVTAEEIRRVFDANVFGTIAVTQAVLPHMRAAKRGRIITITSVGGRISAFGVGVYCASKFAQEGLGEALALELAPFGVQAVMIEPGIIKTTRWNEHRGTAAGADDPSSPYYELFRASEVVADRLVERSRTRPVDVAKAVHTALTAKRPQMRYVVGRPASIVIVLRRYLPARLFERVYFGSFLRRIRNRALAAQPR
jgi:NAD(P)-dependent dehydrogenase (short-subunit alcohol dehydrogenase family)